MIIVKRTDNIDVTLVFGDKLRFEESLVFVLDKKDVPLYMIPLINVIDVRFDYEKPIGTIKEIKRTTKKEE